MTERQEAILLHYKFIWETYKQAQYMQNLDIRQLKEIASLHRELYPDLPYPNLYCKACIIDMFKNLYNLLENA